MPVMPAAWRRLHLSTRVAAILGAAATFLALGPIAVAVVLLRCCDDVRGPSAGAWVVIAVVLLVSALAAGTMMALLVAATRRLWLRSRTP
jgi:hypothetical protein